MFLGISVTDHPQAVLALINSSELRDAVSAVMMLLSAPPADTEVGTHEIPQAVLLLIKNAMVAQEHQ